jgi:hypothetical protein
MQAVLTALFGLLFFLVTPILRSRANKVLHILEKLQRTFVEFNAYAVTIIVISSAIRLAQLPSVSEAVILPLVVSHEAQMFALNLAFSYDHDESVSSIKKYLYIIYYGIVAVLCCLILFVSILFHWGWTGGGSGVEVYATVASAVEACEFIAVPTRLKGFGFRMGLVFLVLVFLITPLARRCFKNVRIFISKTATRFGWFLTRHPQTRTSSRTANTHQDTEAVENDSSCAKSLPLTEDGYVILTWTIGAYYSYYYFDKHFPYSSAVVIILFFNIFFKRIFSSDRPTNARNRRPKSNTTPQTAETTNAPFHRRLAWTPLLILIFALIPIQTLTYLNYHRSFYAQFLQISNVTQWTVGQTTALLAWLPFLVEVLQAFRGNYHISSSLKHRLAE